MNDLLLKARQAAGKLLDTQEETIVRLLKDVADALRSDKEWILSENSKDLSRMDPEDPKYDRLLLTADRIEVMADDICSVASLPSPIGKVLQETVRPNGMLIKKVSVPFGLVGIVYEARPNVTCDVFSLCFKSGNACVLKGGSDAHHSNTAIVSLIHKVLDKYNLPKEVCSLLRPDRVAIHGLLNAVGLVDVVIPRGSSELIDFVRTHSRVPVIETGAGICHTYFDKYGDVEKGKEIVFNAKTRRVSVCNALDCLIIHQARMKDLPDLCQKLKEKKVAIYADQQAYTMLSGYYPAELLQPATPESYGTEFLDYKMSIRTVAGIEEAMEHIARYSSRHSECIISESPERITLFERQVDAACVYANVSTAFTDGGQFGLGAEIGISTQKLHARGPMALPELTTYKYIIEGNGQVRTS